MLLTLTSTAPEASDLGYLLHKHPERVQTFDLPVGRATVFYPEATPERCTAALLLDVDPIGLVRGAKGRTFALAQYVNDRPYAASSLLAVALGRVFATAMQGRCDARPELAAVPLPLEIHLPAVPGDPEVVTDLFVPLGWRVEATPTSLSGGGLDWGAAPYVDLRLVGELRLADSLRHLYVLLPVLDGDKHYWVGPDEVDKLVRRGEGWLAGHPMREFIARRYLAAQHRYVDEARARLDALDDAPAAGAPDGVAEDPADDTEPAAGPARPAPLKARRREAVLDVLREVGAHRVVDVGCGEGYYLSALLADPTFTQVVGADVAPGALAAAERRLGLDRMPDHQRARLTLRQSSVTYRDDTLAGYDALLLVEVVEHVDPDRLNSLEAAVFEAAAPRVVVVTTPNAEHNARYGLPEGALRHPDHRFEWTRAQFAEWAAGVAARRGYAVEHRGVGEPDEALGPPTQLALFTRRDGADRRAS